jgi:16S rRNA G1207 methylase RsmC
VRVLNFGCGFGSFGFLAASKHPNISVHVCDSNEAVIEEAQYRLVEKYSHLLDQVSYKTRTRAHDLL